MQATVVKFSFLFILLFIFQEFERSKAFLFLNEISKKFNAMFGTFAQSAIAYSLDSEFSRVLANEMKHFSNSRDVDTVTKIHGELDDLKKIMVKNIGKKDFKVDS